MDSQQRFLGVHDCARDDFRDVGDSQSAASLGHQLVVERWRYFLERTSACKKIQCGSKADLLVRDRSWNVDFHLWPRTTVPLRDQHVRGNL